MCTSHGQVDILVKEKVAEIKPKKEHLSYSQSKNVNTLNSCQNSEKPFDSHGGLCIFKPVFSAYDNKELQSHLVV